MFPAGREAGVDFVVVARGYVGYVWHFMVAEGGDGVVELEAGVLVAV